MINPVIADTNVLDERIRDYFQESDIAPMFIVGEALMSLQQFPSESVDCCMTSPPYWRKRVYAAKGIGLEQDYHHYINSLCAIFLEVKRVLRSTGSFWLNMGDSYVNKGLSGIPWRIALELIDQQGWTLRNSVIWNKVKGGLDNTKDRLRNVYEYLFHFVKSQSNYYYDADSIRNTPQRSKVVNGSVVSASGVRGVRYKRQLELTTSLSSTEKAHALRELEANLESVRLGKISDFRMIIRGQQRTTHSDSEKVSGRAKELQSKGFYFLRYHPNGSKPSDVWDILPEDRQKRFSAHFAPYPEDLCKIPILATSPTNGTVLDPFCGSGTTMFVARCLGRKSIGIDLSAEYIDSAISRTTMLL
ncbi:MAG: site-specific DNA-methyltransferase [Gammaproteobacteria bacterium]|nr:site-specific DNA-methyltransferase [Gammaproteobacteria bacterium]MYF02880.1 site-specific DNA-methyltransferase [Gammaproteobacteria bacterium]MYI77756.1 site-specific DNA-methyltransferase [Gammaproteobacteria bacterium]